MKRIGAITVSGETYDFRAMSENFSYVSRSVLSRVGYFAARKLYSENLEGILKPRSFSASGAPLSKSGRREVSYSVARDGKSVMVRSFPMNVYRTRGSIYGARTEGKAIFRSFESGFNAEAAAEQGLDDIISGWETRLKAKAGKIF